MMRPETRNHSDGRWQDGAGTLANLNPSDITDVISHYAQASGTQVKAAVHAARHAQPLWWAAGIQKRHDVLMAIGTELMARAAEIGTLSAREDGKTLTGAKGEVTRAGRFFTYLAAKALRLIGDSPFGLTAGIMTCSLTRANHFRSHMRAGCVMVNLPTAGTDYHVPFAGRGASSYGPREQGQYAAEFHTTVKTACVAAGAPE